jgi:GNAT superfamily N-acetyltransferase
MDINPDNPVSIRSYRPADSGACKRLYFDGLIGGRIADNDTAMDIEDIELVYLRPPGNHFWVAESAEGIVIGMIGVQHHGDGIGEIRRLRVAGSHRRRGIGSKLVETALRFCQERQYLKVKLDTFLDEEAAIRLFEKFRFHHDRTRTVNDKQLMYFYLDLYSTSPSHAQQL